MHPSMDPFNNPTLQLGVLGGTCVWWLCPCPWRGGEACCPPRRRDWAGGRAGAGGGHRGGPGAHTARRPGSARSSRARTHGPVHVKYHNFVPVVQGPGSRSALIFPLGSGSRKEKLKKKKQQKCKENGNNCSYVYLYQLHVFLFTFEQSFLSFSTTENSS